MKKAIYYASPFILFPIIFGIFTLLDEIDIINSPLIFAKYDGCFQYIILFIILSTTLLEVMP